MNAIFYTKVKLSGNSFLVLPDLDVKIHIQLRVYHGYTPMEV